jgi:hypothetical protein
LPVFINDEPISTGGQFIQLDLASTSLLQKLVGCEIREYTVTMNYVYQNPNIKKSSLDHVLRYVSRIEQLMQNNISLSLTDSTAAVNCRVESTTFEEGENSYLVSFDYKCQHVSGLSETVATTPALLNNFSMSFDGSNDYIDFGNDTSLQITGAISISCWVKTSNTSSTQYLVAKDDNTNRNFSLATESSTGKAWFTFFNSGVNKQVKSTNHNVCDDNWNHIVALFDPSTRKSAIYVNGTLSAESVDHSVTTIDNDTVNLEMGRRGNGVFYLDGFMDEVAIWDKTLSSSEISAIYNQKIGSSTTLDLSYNTTDYTSADNLLAFWRMGDRGFASTSDGIMSDDQNSDKLVFGHNDSLGDELIDFSEWTGSGSAGTQEIIDDVIVLTDSITGGNTFRQNTINIEDNEYYMISYEVFDFVKGQLRFSVGNQVSGYATANGHYIFFVKHTSGLSRVYTYSGISTTLKVRDLSIKKLISSSVGTMTNMETSSVSSEVPKQVTGLRQVTNTKSLDFDGTDGHLDAGNDSSLVPTSAMTISAWIKVDWDNNPDYPRIVDKNFTSYRLAIDRLAVEKSLFFFINGQFAKSAANALNTDNWQHVVGVFDKSLHSASNSIRLYVNGNEVSYSTQQSSGSDITSTSDNLHIGSDITDDKYFAGNIDEVAIWNTALDGDAVKAVYNGGKPTDLMMDNGAYDEYTDNIKGYWRMGDGDTFPTILDNSSNSNNATMTHMDSGDIEEDTP